MQKDKFIGQWAFPKDDSFLEGSARRGERYDLKEIARDLIDKLHFEADDKVLDVCCGNAALTRYIAKACKEIHGVDHSKVLLKSAQGIKQEDGLENLKLHEADAMSIDRLFAEDQFDKTYCYFSFQYFNKNDREALLQKLSYVTQRKGWIFIGDIPDKTRIRNYYPSMVKFWREKFMRMLRGKDGECALGWWVDPKEIIEWCDKHKLQASIIKQENLPHAHYRFDVLIRNSK